MGWRDSEGKKTGKRDLRTPIVDPRLLLEANNIARRSLCMTIRRRDGGVYLCISQSEAGACQKLFHEVSNFNIADAMLGRSIVSRGEPLLTMGRVTCREVRYEPIANKYLNHSQNFILLSREFLTLCIR